MFVGHYEHSIDAKGRMIIPARYREELGEHFIITKGMDGCLYALPQDAFVELTEELKKLPISVKDSRVLVRHFSGAAADGEPDKQGRVLLPAALRAHAGIEKDVVFVGVLNKVEIWSKDRWENASGETDADMEAVEEHLAALGLSI